MGPSPVEELVLLDLDRSNKGASKQRRDQINSEIATMRDLLPLPESARQRLSQLQIMSLSCVYIRKCNVLQKLFRSSGHNKDLPATCDFFQALTGFLLITTRDGKLIYISENVTDYLGHSMVDMKTQGDSLYDIVDKRDHGTVQAQLHQGGVEQDEGRDVSFFCRMNMSRSLKRQAGFGDVKVMYVKGHFVPAPGQDSSDQQYVFMATCTPLITPDLKENLVQNNTMVFKTVHRLDMAFLEVSQTAEHHLGYNSDELFQKSWYNMLHPEDIHEAKEKHIQLIRSNHEMGCMMIVRMLKADGSIFWVNLVMHVRQTAGAHSDEPVIMCVNQVISEQEAYQFKLQSQMFHFYPPRGPEPWPQAGSCQAMPSEQDSRWLQANTGFPLSPRLRGMNSGVYDPTIGHSANYVPFIDPRMRRGEQLNNGGQCQTDRLKAMLKRKIQGPCKPAKVPKLSLSDHGGDKFNFDFGSSSLIPNLESFSEPFSSLSSNQSTWAESTQVLSQANFGMSTVGLQKKNIFLEHSLSSYRSTSPSEQVVPDVMVPESYLTPDPSPASSPDPKCTSVKADVTDVMANRYSTSSILQELTQLAELPGTCTVKTDVPYRRISRRQKELPVMDAIDIDSFFENLGVQSISGLHKPGKCDAGIPNPPVMCKQEPLIKKECMQTKPKRVLPLIDATELEEFFNHFSETESVDCESAVPEVFCEPQYMNGNDLSSVKHINRPRDFSPESLTSSELSEEEEELLEELSSKPMAVTLSVKVKDDFASLQDTKQPLDACGPPEEDELYQLHKLLSSLTPADGAGSFPEETQ